MVEISEILQSTFEQINQIFKKNEEIINNEMANNKSELKQERDRILYNNLELKKVTQGWYRQSDLITKQ
ncbi:unnamed protein product (macronuclear) [Paramecium tetraurelia]|uniref:Uncharacterized protein n=1 Tax=Paramecium tetraurelia TaxID=5888 RepID=A0CPZ5_PARTE|nr:uncharacterized protein GSPATT00038819001 [Paramecium tetraurelia]CAK72862.1 unnamed protein product [Paramecium tetraurelia]|eukprot:XP_001440259.1 hypothetical protein (macronuclear) [Paramecium tetraurelia strain d4-2]